MRRLFFSWLVLAAAIAIVTALMPGVDVHGGVLTYLWIAAIFAFVNTLLGPLLRLLTAPLIIFTLGLFALVVNALLFLMTSWLSDSLHVDGFFTAVVAAFFISIVDTVLEFVFHIGRRHREAAQVS